jgi:Putative lumazine-binding
MSDTTTAAVLKDIADIRAVIQLYVEGANGDGAKLKEAFHPDAWMMGHIGPMDTYVPISEFIGMVEAQPGMAGPNYSWTIRTVDVTGDAGVAVLVESDFFGCDFVDYFTVARIAGRWQITNKTFAHTGGQPPAHRIALRGGVRRKRGRNCVGDRGPTA